MEQGYLQRWRIIWNNFIGQFSNVLIFAVIVYFLVIVGRSMYLSYQDHQGIEQKKADITSLERQVIYLENQNLYYQTVSYKEKEARKKLGFIKPGETVVALNRVSALETEVISTENDQEIKQPNYLRWWEYFFGE